MKNYNCFSYKLRQYLVSNGMEEIGKMVHSRTGRTFWIFEQNNELNQLLTNWTNRTNL